jgi:hypothetical protein
VKVAPANQECADVLGVTLADHFRPRRSGRPKAA